MITSMPFGSTGHASTRVIFGAAALGAMSQGRADTTLAALHETGVNHIDTARSYGESELRLAPWLTDHRGEVFLASKTGERSGAGARRELEESLGRLGVDQLDLIQLHNLVEDDEWETAHAPGGAVDAMVQAREEGLVRFIGVTGHGLRIARKHIDSLHRFPFDSVLLPYSPVLLRDDGYAHDVAELRALCADRGVAVQTIKAIARRRWTPDDPSAKFSWYEPVRDVDAIERMVRFVLSTPDLFLNTSSDATLLGHALAIAQRLEDAPSAPSVEELDADITALGIEAIFDGAALERI